MSKDRRQLNVFSEIGTGKDKAVITLAYRRTKDRRQLNKVSWMENRLGNFYVFGEIGTGKAKTVIILAYRRTKRGILSVYKKYRRYVGEVITKVPRNL